ncbi:MAG: hypothetical protein IJ025_03015 [Clostridia bacterium]|nr:hypothetical protein [Clostridia bacterium]
MTDFLGAVITFTAGIGIATLNYYISKYFLEKNPDKFAMTTVVKQIFNVGYLVAVYMFGDFLPFKLSYLLIGAVLGITLPMFIYTRKLLKLNESKRVETREKEGESDG